MHLATAVGLLALSQSVFSAAFTPTVFKRGVIAGEDCEYTPVPKPPKTRICNAQGTLNSAKTAKISTNIVPYYDCRDGGLANSQVLSFSWQSTTGNCTYYSKKAVNQGFKFSKTSGVMFWSRLCFKKTGKTNCDGACVDLQTDRSYCGSCDNSCPDGKTCQNGVCACAPGLDTCSGTCVNLQQDNTNCGACGSSCNPASGASCSNGACTCPSGKDNCSGTCFNFQEDNNNCGGCGVRCDTSRDSVCENGSCTAGCPTGSKLCGGTCIDVTSDSQNCGHCGVKCTIEVIDTCKNGVCAYGGSPFKLKSQYADESDANNEILQVRLANGPTRLSYTPPPNQLPDGIFTLDPETEYVTTTDAVHTIPQELGAQDVPGVEFVYLQFYAQDSGHKKVVCRIEGPSIMLCNVPAASFSVNASHRAEDGIYYAVVRASDYVTPSPDSSIPIAYQWDLRAVAVS